MEDEKASAPKDERRQSSSRYLRLTRLPTLQEVLDRRTRPPLDLFCFYVSRSPECKRTDCLVEGPSADARQIFLQRESSEDALDFWLDVQQHENMCKAYFKASSAVVYTRNFS